MWEKAARQIDAGRATYVGNIPQSSLPRFEATTRRHHQLQHLPSGYPLFHMNGL